MSLKILSANDLVGALIKSRSKSTQPFLAMYSSWLGGVVKDPSLMVVPIDDHLVHRGDGIFEAMKVVDKRLYLCEEHLDRLFESAKKCSLKIPVKKPELRQLIVDTIRVAGTSTATIRLFVSRGPGGFSPNPYDSVESQIYIIVTEPKPYDPKKYKTGVVVGLSNIPMKESFFSTIKSCNYLPNVLMKKEAVDNDWDFPINISSSGFVGEGSTENIALISKENEFLVPSFKYTLRGTTLVRLMTLAKPIVKRVSEKDLKCDDFYEAKEVMMFGTTIGVVPVVKFNGKKISDGKPGPMAKKFSEIFYDDIASTKPEEI